MRIGELAAKAGVSTKTIRYYEQIGLLPVPSREDNGYRAYDDSVADRIGFVVDAQTTGLSLAEISQILELRSGGARTCHHVKDLLVDHLSEVDTRIRALRQTRLELSRLIDRADRLDPEGCTDPNRCQVIARRERLS